MFYFYSSFLASKMIKVSFKLNISFCELIVVIISLSAIVGSVRYFPNKKNSDENSNVTTSAKI